MVESLVAPVVVMSSVAAVVLSLVATVIEVSAVVPVASLATAAAIASFDGYIPLFCSVI